MVVFLVFKKHSETQRLNRNKFSHSFIHLLFNNIDNSIAVLKIFKLYLFIRPSNKSKQENNKRKIVSSTSGWYLFKK